MAANLTPQYLKAQEEYRRATTADDQIRCLELMLQLVPKHKASEKLQAELKSKLKEARDESAAEKKAPKKTKSIKIPRQGAGQVVIIGGPNAGKSRLLAELTNAKPEVAPYPFTTREPMPGMMPWEDVKVQLVDTPAIANGAIDSGILGMIRSADGVLLCFDGSSDDAPEHTAEILGLLKDRKTVLSNRSGFDEEDFSTVHVKSMLVVTRADDADFATRLDFLRDMDSTSIETEHVEFDRPATTESIRNRIFKMLEVIRVYTKAPGKPADYTSPYTIPAGGTVEDLAHRIHKDLADSLKFAKIWGSGVHEGQSVGPDHVLFDKDLVELHT